MSDNIHADMHIDHRHWLSEHAMWREDIELWRKEIRQACKDLKGVSAVLDEHDKALQAHTEAIAGHEQSLTDHESALADYERGGQGDKLVVMAKDHKKSASRYEQQRDAHERIKKHHHTIIAQLSMLLKALAKPV